jgi:acetylornithine deacetylase/succinyl-diaminopimelate desuccinylase-like protein
VCLEWFRRERNWINEQHLKLCRIPAPTFFEEKRAVWMAEQFQALGWEARLDRAGNVVATWPGAGASPMAVTAHLDTVLAPRTPDDIKTLRDGRMAGPGVADNGAGLAALLALAAAWKAAPPLEDSGAAPILVANVGEEGEGNLSGMRYFCRAASGQPQVFLVLDGPGTDHITSRALASQRFEVTISGPGGHSWRDSAHGNPVHALSRAVTLFTDQATASVLGSPPGPRSSFNFGIFEGGSSINSIPTEARAKIDLRSESLGRIDEMAAALTLAVDQAVESENARGSGPRIAARIKEIGSRPSGELPDNAPLLEAVRAVDTHLGIRSRLDCSSTDANIPLSLGLQAVSIGAGGQGAGAHTPAEWYLPEGRDLALRRILLAVCLLLTNE